MDDKRKTVLSQHHDLDFEADRLDLLAAADPDAVAPGRARQILERELRGLIDRLRAHFRYEEAGGYMAGVGVEKPHLAAEILRLREGHDELRDEMARLEEASFEDGPIAGFRQEIRAFLGRIRHHEQAENEVLERFITEEYGR
ncbi:MAG: hemerythrin domain-containing protein [Planctomycetes bacterium]|nr:hemerythrin domain-containing protein [Planctomycetota bacterium]